MSRKGILKKVNKAAIENVPQTTGLVYRGEANATVVGYWLNGLFVVLSRHKTRAEALNRINALNGGTGTVFGGTGAGVGGAVAA